MMRERNHEPGGLARAVIAAVLMAVLFLRPMPPAGDAIRAAGLHLDPQSLICSLAGDSAGRPDRNRTDDALDHPAPPFCCVLLCGLGSLLPALPPPPAPVLPLAAWQAPAFPRATADGPPPARFRRAHAARAPPVLA